MMKLVIVFTVAALIATQSGFAQDSQEDIPLTDDCGQLANTYGPWDYTNPIHYRDRLPVVERAHFDANVESLVKGTTAALPGGDLDYTLRAFPNHHRALYSMGRYSLKHSDRRIPPGARYSGLCYFVRAINFNPDDAKVRVVFGIYFYMQEKYQQAIEQLKVAIGLNEHSAEAHYNIGLVYERLGELELAVQHARTAYDLGFPLAGLRNKLQRHGVWEVDGSSR